MAILTAEAHLERATWLEIDADALEHNIAVWRRLIRSRFMAVIKGNAYGHGAMGVARFCEQGGVDWFGVATPCEGENLRAVGIEKPILVLSPTVPAQAGSLVAGRMSCAVTTIEMVRALEGTGAGVHLKVNTGMNRSGLEPEDVPGFLRAARSVPGVRIEGIFSHFHSADAIDRLSAYRQFEVFTRLLRGLEEEGLRPPLAHIANSAAAIDMPETALDMVRIGIGLYGLYPSENVSRHPNVRPILSWKARVVEVRRLKPGDAVSYGATFVAERPTTVALLPVGYADGFRRILSNKADVLIRGRRCRVAGRVCMDLTVIDCGDLPVEIGDEAVLIGRQGEEEITAEEMAGWQNTINYEVVTQIRERVPRRIVRGASRMEVCTPSDG